MSKKPIHIAVTGGGGRLAYSLLFRIAAGDLFGLEQPIVLSIRDIEENRPLLEGLVMEIEDGAFPLLKGVKIGSDPYQIFQDAEIAILIGSKARGPGMERKDLLLDNAKIFVDEGKALNEVASRDVKVLVVGNPCNTNCLIAMSHAPKIPRRNFHALMRLDHNRAKSQLSKKAGLPVEAVTNVTVWGNHSASQVPDFTHALIEGKPAVEVIQDPRWFQEDFVSLVRGRGAQIIQARKRSSEASAAQAVLDDLRSLFNKTEKGDWFSAAVPTDGSSYGIEKNIVFGFPCASKGDGQMEIVEKLELSYWLKEQMTITQKELIEERECVKEFLGSL